MALSKAARGALGVVLLLCSNAFMNAAWYTHLKFENWNMAMAIFISWGIALPEYALQVPANRLAHVSHGGPFTAPQLKVIAEVCSLTTFAIFSSIVLKEKLRWVDLGAFALILAGVLLSLLTKPASTVASPPPIVPPIAEPRLAAPGTIPTAEIEVTDLGKNRKLMLVEKQQENVVESRNGDDIRLEIGIENGAVENVADCIGIAVPSNLGEAAVTGDGCRRRTHTREEVGDV